MWALADRLRGGPLTVNALNRSKRREVRRRFRETAAMERLWTLVERQTETSAPAPTTT